MTSIAPHTADTAVEKTTSKNTPTFAGFNMHQHLNTALEQGGFSIPTPVQAQAIPAVMNGMDVLASAPTGTGKTGAFVIPALHRLLTTPLDKTTNPKGRGPRLLVLTPTRELAQQVLDSVRVFGKTAGMKVGVIVGGVGYAPQYRLLESQLDVLVATPGRLIDHLQQGRVDWSRIELVVLDEADRMLDMGFLKPVERIFAAIGKKTQTLLFTATLTPSIYKVARTVLENPAMIELAPAKPNHSLITQKVYRTDNAEHKFSVLNELLKTAGVDQAIIFAATKHGSDKLAKKLQSVGYSSDALHGGMKQNARKRTLDSLHSGKIKLLVATDVAARGIDVKELGHVINYDLPQVAEDYVHRIGRTGRSGSKGMAISLVAPSDWHMMRDIEKLLGKKMDLAHLEGYEPGLEDAEFNRQGSASPKTRQTKGRGGQGGGSREGGRSEGRGDSRGGGRSFAPREGGSRDEGRFEPRPAGRSEGSFGGGRSDSRFGGRSSAPRAEGRPEGRFERSDSRGGGFARAAAQRPSRIAEGGAEAPAFGGASRGSAPERGGFQKRSHTGAPRNPRAQDGGRRGGRQGRDGR